MMSINPFKILTPLSKEDVNFFHGRESELTQLYEIVNSGPLTFVYGESGAGKTSLVKCGLSKMIDDSDWVDIWVRRGDNLIDSIKVELCKRLSRNTQKELKKRANLNSIEDLDNIKITDLIKNVYLDNFRPIYLIIDDFEELFTIGSEEEKESVLKQAEEFLDRKFNVKIILILKEDFVGNLQEFEKNIPISFHRGLKVPLMEFDTAKKVIELNIENAKIQARPNVRTISERIAKEFVKNKRTVDLLNLQIFLNKLWTLATQARKTDIAFDLELVENLIGELGDVDNLLENYLIATVQETDQEREFGVWDFLQHFVAASGTRQRVRLSQVSDVKLETLESWTFYLKDKKIIQNESPDIYELSHERLAGLIYERKQKKIKPRLTFPTITGSPWKGLLAYETDDCDLFFGRKRVVSELIKKIKNESLVAIVGPSGVGKSSLVKAGLIPYFKNAEFRIIQIKPEDLIKSENKSAALETSINKLKKEILNEADSKVLLYVDQFEQLSTRFDDKELSAPVIALINSLASEASNKPDKEIKIVLSIRSDYEFEFDLSFKDWRNGKFNVPNFLDEELREIIEIPAYNAGLEFKPSYLVDVIIRDAQQSNGTLPLLSYTLHRMFEVYQENPHKDGFLSEDIFNEVGGIIGGLQSKANKIYNKYPKQDPHRKTIRNVILRMVTGMGERAGKKVYSEELIFPLDEENLRVTKILDEFICSSLVVTGKDLEDKIFYEPAHDSLVKNWIIVKNWISEESGKAFFYYSPTLKEAIKDKAFNKLWDDDPRLDALKTILNTPNNWLNKHETDFINESIKKRKGKKVRRLGVAAFLILLLCLFSFKLYEAENAKKQSIISIINLEREKALAKSNEERVNAENERAKAEAKRKKADEISIIKDRESQRVGKKNAELQQKIQEINSLTKELKSTIKASERKNDLLTEEKFKNDLLKERFIRNVDRARQTRLIDTLVKLRLDQNDEIGYRRLLDALNKVSEASEIRSESTNKALALAKQAFEAYPNPPIDSMALQIANRNLFYTTKLDQTYRIGSSIYLTALSKDKKQFAYANANGVKVGSITNGIPVITMSLVFEPESIKGNKFQPIKSQRNRDLSSLTFTDNNALIGVIGDYEVYKWEKFDQKPKVVTIIAGDTSNKKIKANFSPYDNFPIEKDGVIHVTAVSPDGKQLITNNKSKFLRFINIQDIKNPKEQHLGILSDKDFGYISNILYSPDGMKILLTLRNYVAYILDINKKTTRQIKDSIIYTANFTPDGRNVICESENSIFLTDLEGNKVANSLSARDNNFGVASKITMSSDWKSLIVENFHESRLIERTSNNYEKAKLFNLSRSSSDSIIVDPYNIYSYGNFGFIGQNSILSYTRAVLKDSVFTYSILRLEKYDYFKKFSDAYSSINPVFSINEKKELGLIKLDERESYNKALEYLKTSTNPLVAPETKRENLLKGQTLLNNVIVKNNGDINEVNFSLLKRIDRRIFELDNNFDDYSKEVKKHIQIDRKLFLKYSTNPGSSKYIYYKERLHVDKGNLSFYLIFTKEPNFTEVINTAKEGLALATDRQNDYINTNLALAYLLTKNFSKAKDIYIRLKGKKASQSNRNFTQSFLNDIALLERKKVISKRDPAVFEVTQKIKCWLQDAGCSLN